MSQLRKGEPGDICKKCQFLSKFNNQNDENIAELSKYYLFGGAGAHHVGSRRVNNNRGCVTGVGLRDY